MIQVKTSPWPGYDGKCVQHTIRDKRDDDTLGNEAIVIVIGESGFDGHVNWREARFRDSRALRSMLNMMEVADRILENHKDEGRCLYCDSA